MIYLDNAATSFPKPEAVYAAAEKAVRELGGNPSRSGHILSGKSGEAIFSCREALAKMFGARVENVVFTLNATHALNTAIKGIARHGDHFLISNIEHNAVLRPIASLCERIGCSYDTIDVIGKKDHEIIAQIYQKRRKNTRAVVMNHASNLCSVHIPARAIGSFCKKEGIVFILDASQSAGHIPIDIVKDNINILCAPAHKGLFGIMGLGFLISDGKHEISTLIEGGSGYSSADIHMPKELPEHLEAGTLPVPAIASLEAGCSFVNEIGVREIHMREAFLHSCLCDRLSSLRGVRIYEPERRGSCLLFNLDGIPSDTVGEYLADRGICVRCGFHCAPLAHKSLNTGEYGGVRVSFSPFNSLKDADALFEAVRDLQKESSFMERG